MVFLDIVHAAKRLLNYTVAKPQKVVAELAAGTRKRMEGIEVERTSQLRSNAKECEISSTNNIGLCWVVRLTDNNSGQPKSH